MSTVEPQYEPILGNDYVVNHLGLMSGHTWSIDPKRLTFVLSRYKFVSKMLKGYKNVLEIGCGDGWASSIVAKEVKNLTAVDIDPIFIEHAKQYTMDNIIFKVHDMINDKNIYPIDRIPKYFDGAYALDVLEHIVPEQEGVFLGNICLSIGPRGTFICGSPSLESQTYASDISKKGHVNCKSEDELRNTLNRYFNNVYLFGMNDEVLHTGFGPLCHYRLAICAGAKL